MIFECMQETPASRRGQGLGGQLVRFAFDALREEQNLDFDKNQSEKQSQTSDIKRLQVKGTCWFVQDFIKKHGADYQQHFEFI